MFRCNKSLILYHLLYLHNYYFDIGVRTSNSARAKSDKNSDLYLASVQFVKLYSHQLMHFFIQLCIRLLSYIKIT